MSKRRTLTKNQKQDIFVRERWTCRYCAQLLRYNDEIEWDHAQALARGGKDELENIVPLHRDCHLLKTFHPRSKATTLVSDIFEAAKTKRLIRKRTPKAGKSKMQSRPFSKRWKKKMDGSVEIRDG